MMSMRERTEWEWILKCRSPPLRIFYQVLRELMSSFFNAEVVVNGGDFCEEWRTLTVQKSQQIIAREEEPTTATIVFSFPFLHILPGAEQVLVRSPTQGIVD